MTDDDYYEDTPDFATEAGLHPIGTHDHLIDDEPGSDEYLRKHGHNGVGAGDWLRERGVEPADAGAFTIGTSRVLDDEYGSTLYGGHQEPTPDEERRLEQAQALDRAEWRSRAPVPERDPALDELDAARFYGEIPPDLDVTPEMSEPVLTNLDASGDPLDPSPMAQRGGVQRPNVEQVRRMIKDRSGVELFHGVPKPNTPERRALEDALLALVGEAPEQQIARACGYSGGQVQPGGAGLKWVERARKRAQERRG